MLYSSARRYNLFSSNVISGTLAFVYFPHNQYFSLVINLSTLLGSVFGQFLFGFLADRYGRTRLYGIELALVIISTIGVATASTGFDGNMSFLALFSFVRSMFQCLVAQFATNQEGALC